MQAVLAIHFLLRFGRTSFAAPILVLLWLSPASLNAATPSAAPAMQPPGDCTAEEHKRLKEEVGRACKATSMKCYEAQGCAELLTNYLLYQRCISARVAVMDKCFRGGDKTHRDEVENYKRGAAECSRMMVQKRCPEQCR
jgi:hypothetical protein